jgi:hypothetical protein
LNDLHPQDLAISQPASINRGTDLSDPWQRVGKEIGTPELALIAYAGLHSPRLLYLLDFTMAQEGRQEVKAAPLDTDGHIQKKRKTTSTRN